MGKNMVSILEEGVAAFLWMMLGVFLLIVGCAWLIYGSVAWIGGFLVLSKFVLINSGYSGIPVIVKILCMICGGIVHIWTLMVVHNLFAEDWEKYALPSFIDW